MRSTLECAAVDPAPCLNMLARSDIMRGRVCQYPKGALMERRSANNFRCFAVTTILLSLPLFAQRVIAAPPQVTPYVSAEVVNDDNIFRFADDQDSLNSIGSEIETETIYSVGGGVNVDWRISRQRIRVGVDAKRNLYDQYDALDHTAADGDITLNWVRGSLWSGTLQYGYKRELSSFTERNTITRDIKTTDRFVATAERPLTTRWTANVGGSFRDVDFSDRDAGREVVGLVAGARYTSRKRNWFGAEVNFRDVDFPNQTADLEAGRDDGYEKTDVYATARWSPAGHSVFDVRAGYTKREQNNISEDDFDGVTGRIVYTWTPTGKTAVATSTWRDVSALNDEISNYAEVTGIGVEVSYQATNKLSFLAGVEFEDRDFQGEPDPEFQDVELREDEIVTFGFGVRYEPRSNLQVSLDYDTAERDSTAPDSEYSYNRLTAKTRFWF